MAVRMSYLSLTESIICEGICWVFAVFADIDVNGNYFMRFILAVTLFLDDKLKDILYIFKRESTSLIYFFSRVPNGRPLRSSRGNTWLVSSLWLPGDNCLYLVSDCWSVGDR